MDCQHKPIFYHASPGLAFVRCAHCRRRWTGNPQDKNAPRWVTDVLPAALAEIAQKATRRRHP
jgi:hypothetical protein